MFVGEATAAVTLTLFQGTGLSDISPLHLSFKRHSYKVHPTRQLYFRMPSAIWFPQIKSAWSMIISVCKGERSLSAAHKYAPGVGPSGVSASLGTPFKPDMEPPEDIARGGRLPGTLTVTRNKLISFPCTFCRKSWQNKWILLTFSPCWELVMSLVMKETLISEFSAGLT